MVAVAVTQLRAPAAPPEFVDRPRLRDALVRGADGPVTLVCGPPGCGKTTLIATALAGAPRVAWLTLEPAQDDSSALWDAVLTALRTVADVPAPGAGGAPVPALVNALADLTSPLVLVLDDVHVLRSSRCREELSRLIQRAPAQLRLVLGSRCEPALALHAARLHGSLTEIRAADLAFSGSDAERLCARAGLAAGSGRRLRERSEGWAAGLRLGVLGLRESGGERRFAGDDGTVADYLVSEALGAEPPRRRAFLLEVSIAGRLCAGLADAITGRGDGAAMLERLERANGFVLPVADRRGWYRLHTLFAELLRAEARRQLGEDAIRERHRRAAGWLAADGQAWAALEHGVEGADWALVRRVILSRWLELSPAGDSARLRGLLARVPADEVAADPQLAAVVAAEPGPARPAPAANGAVGIVVRLRAARSDADADAALAAAEELADEASSWPWAVRRSVGRLEAGRAALWSGRSVQARALLSDALRVGRASGAGGVVAAASAQLALAEALHAGPEPARALLADAGPGGDWLATAVVALCELRGADAQAALDAAGPARQEPQVRDVVALVRARLAALAGDTEWALRVLPAAPAVMAGPVAALRARLLLRTAGSAAAERALAGAPPGAEASVGAALVRLARADPDGAREFLVGAAGDARALGDTPVAADVALALAAGECAAGDAALERSLERGAALGHRAVFLELGEGVAPLLRRRIRERSRHAALAGELLDAFAGRETRRPAVAPLREPLSGRERSVLRLLPTALSNQQIAGELLVSTNTIKTHLRSVYRKLEASGRGDAVARARELGLLAPGRAG